MTSLVTLVASKEAAVVRLVPKFIRTLIFTAVSAELALVNADTVEDLKELVLSSLSKILLL